MRAAFDQFAPDAVLSPTITADFGGRVAVITWGGLLILTVDGVGGGVVDRALKSREPAERRMLMQPAAAGLDYYEGQDRMADVQPDQMVLRRLTGEGAFRSTGSPRFICVVLPRAKTPEMDLAPCLMLSAKTAHPSWRVLWQFLPTIEHTARRLPASGEAVCDVLGGLVTLAISANAASGVRLTKADFANAYPQKVDQYLRRHFGNPGLSPALVAQELGISVRYLNKLLAPGGSSFRQRLVGIRLEACRIALADPSQSDLTIAEIAFGAGFNDLSQFNRQFRLAFGVTPSILRSARLSQSDAAPQRSYAT